MTPEQQEQRWVGERAARWSELEALLARADGNVRRLAGDDVERLPAAMRELAADLVRARSRRMSASVVARLEAATARAHVLLYGARRQRIGTFVEFVLLEGPRAVRRSAASVWVATALFVVPLLVSLVGTLTVDGFAQSVLSPQLLGQMERAYAEGFSGRTAGESSAMTGFYVKNNVGIAFRCFATGVLFGLGTVFFLIYNGVVIGGVLGWVIRSGHGENIVTFVSGHGSFELTAIVLSGAAGLRMGWALLRPGTRSRLGALQAQVPDLVPIVVTAAAMLLVAAGIEAWWSPSTVAAPVKWGVAATLWVSVIAWLSLAGRTR
jgi:uncharacterized membrane protein SpoIIM required for sporulation